MAVTRKTGEQRTEPRYHVCTAHHEFLSEAMRELEERVLAFLKLGCSLHGPTSVVIQPETWRTRQRFFVSQPITERKPD